MRRKAGVSRSRLGPHSFLFPPPAVSVRSAKWSGRLPGTPYRSSLDMTSLKDRDAELKYQAAQAKDLAGLRPSRLETIERYRECRGADLHRKEFTFSLLHRVKPDTVLDFGCGDGECTVQLAHCGYRVTGFDVSPDQLTVARRRAELDEVGDRVRFLQAA